jgi:small subunit ribosomal protein S6
MMKDYETVFILTPVLSEAQVKDTAAKFMKILTDNKSEIINEESWGLRKLAYPIDHKNTGFYHLVEFRANPEVIAALEQEYRRDEKVMRFLTVTLDKHALAYNVKRKKGAFKKSKKAENKEEKKA